jgi:hypothetical protein
VVFGALGTAVGMAPVFWMDGALLAAGAWLIGRDAAARAAARGLAEETELPPPRSRSV